MKIWKSFLVKIYLWQAAQFVQQFKFWSIKNPKNSYCQVVNVFYVWIPSPCYWSQPIPTSLQRVSNEIFTPYKLIRIKSNGPYLRPSKSSHDPVVIMKFEFCTHLARLLRKLVHVLLLILSTNTDSAVSVQKKENFND